MRVRTIDLATSLQNRLADAECRVQTEMSRDSRRVQGTVLSSCCVEAVEPSNEESCELGCGA